MAATPSAVAGTGVRITGAAVVRAEQLARRAAIHRLRGERIVFTNGCFDVLHRGHVSCLQAARGLGDVLVVAVNSDAGVRRLKGPGRPVNPAADRTAVLAALRCVDYVTVFDDDTPLRLIEQIRPDYFVKGGDYRMETLPEAAAVAGYGGRVVILAYLRGRSTTAIAERVRAAATPPPAAAGGGVAGGGVAAGNLAEPQAPVPRLIR